MFNNFSSETFLLDASITLLGLAVIVLVVFVARLALQAIRVRKSGRDSYAFNIEEVGTTMADGGVRIDGSTKDEQFFSDEISDPGNIFRSNN